MASATNSSSRSIPSLPSGNQAELREPQEPQTSHARHESNAPLSGDSAPAARESGMRFGLEEQVAAGHLFALALHARLQEASSGNEPPAQEGSPSRGKKRPVSQSFQQAHASSSAVDTLPIRQLASSSAKRSRGIPNEPQTREELMEELMEELEQRGEDSDNYSWFSLPRDVTIHDVSQSSRASLKTGSPLDNDTYRLFYAHVTKKMPIKERDIEMQQISKWLRGKYPNGDGIVGLLIAMNTHMGESLRNGKWPKKEEKEAFKQAMIEVHPKGVVGQRNGHFLFHVLSGGKYTGEQHLHEEYFPESAQVLLKNFDAWVQKTIPYQLLAMSRSLINRKQSPALHLPALLFLEARLETEASFEWEEIGAMDDDTANFYRRQMQLPASQEFGYACFLQFVRELTLTQDNREKLENFTAWVNRRFDLQSPEKNKKPERGEKELMSYRSAATRLLMALQKNKRSTQEGDIVTMDDGMIEHYREQAGNNTFEYDCFLQFDREEILEKGSEEKIDKFAGWMDWLIHTEPPPKTWREREERVIAHRETATRFFIARQWEKTSIQGTAIDGIDKDRHENELARFREFLVQSGRLEFSPMQAGHENQHRRH